MVSPSDVQRTSHGVLGQATHFVLPGAVLVVDDNSGRSESVRRRAPLTDVEPGRLWFLAAVEVLGEKEQALGPVDQPSAPAGSNLPTPRRGRGQGLIHLQVLPWQWGGTGLVGGGDDGVG